MFVIKESNIIETKSKEDIQKFCFLNLTLKQKTKKMLSGSFIGYYTDKKICAKGEVLLMEKKKIEKLKKVIQKKVGKKQIRKKESLQTLKKNESVSINCKSSYINLYVWDSKTEDGDEITVLANEKTILEKYKVTTKRKKVKLKLKKGVTNLKVIANSIGNIKPNTVGIEIFDKNFIFPFITKLNLNESSTIKINH